MNLLLGVQLAISQHCFTDTEQVFTAPIMNKVYDAIWSHQGRLSHAHNRVTMPDILIAYLHQDKIRGRHFSISDGYRHEWCYWNERITHLGKLSLIFIILASQRCDWWMFFRGYGELYFWKTDPDSKVHGANMGPIWGRQDPGGPHELCYLGF